MMPEGHFHRSRIAQLDEDEEDEEDEDDDPCRMPVMQFLPLPLPLSLSFFLSFFLSFSRRFLRDSSEIAFGFLLEIAPAWIPPGFLQSMRLRLVHVNRLLANLSTFFRMLQDS